MGCNSLHWYGGAPLVPSNRLQVLGKAEPNYIKLLTPLSVVSLDSEVWVDLHKLHSKATTEAPTPTPSTPDTLKPWAPKP